MKRVRKSPQSRKETYDEAAEPLHRHSKSDAEGNVIFVTDKKGYPAAGERISDDMAGFTLKPIRGGICTRVLNRTPPLSYDFPLFLAGLVEGPTAKIDEERLGIMHL